MGRVYGAFGGGFGGHVGFDGGYEEPIESEYRVSRGCGAKRERER